MSDRERATVEQRHIELARYLHGGSAGRATEETTAQEIADFEREAVERERERTCEFDDHRHLCNGRTKPFGFKFCPYCGGRIAAGEQEGGGE